MLLPGWKPDVDSRDDGTVEEPPLTRATKEVENPTDERHHPGRCILTIAVRPDDRPTHKDREEKTWGSSRSLILYGRQEGVRERRWNGTDRS